VEKWTDDITVLINMGLGEGVNNDKLKIAELLEYEGGQLPVRLVRTYNYFTSLSCGVSFCFFYHFRM
jgi:hypothetical protein